MKATQAILDNLKAARALLSDKSKWTTRSFARTTSGNPIGPTEAGAVCWCAEGALTKTGLANGLFSWIMRQDYLTDNDCLVTLNDYVGYEAVIARLDSLIETAAEEVASSA